MAILMYTYTTTKLIFYLLNPTKTNTKLSEIKSQSFVQQNKSRINRSKKMDDRKQVEIGQRKGSSTGPSSTVNQSEISPSVVVVGILYQTERSERHWPEILAAIRTFQTLNSICISLTFLILLLPIGLCWDDLQISISLLLFRVRFKNSGFRKPLDTLLKQLSRVQNNVFTTLRNRCLSLQHQFTSPFQFHTQLANCYFARGFSQQHFSVRCSLFASPPLWIGFVDTLEF